MLFDEGDDKMVKTEAFPTIRMKIDRLLKITNEYQFNDLVKAVYCINLCINNRSVLESCLALNACLIEYEEKGSKRIGTYDEFKGFFGKIYDVMKPGIADDYTVEDFGEVQLRYNDKFYRVIIGTGHNNVYACLNFLPTLARNISREEELCLALEYVSGTIDYFIEENKNDGVVEKRFVLPTEILFYKVQKFFKEEVKKYDILELDSLMMSEGTTIEKSHFVCREDNIYPLYNVSLLIDLYDIWENKIDFKEQISVANEGIIDRIYSLFEMDRSRSCSIFAPAMIFPEQKYDSSQRTYTFIAKASRGVVVALNADEYEEGQLEKEIANIEKYHKSGTLHIAETFNRFDKSGLSGFLITDNEVGLIKQYCGAVAVSWYSRFMDGKESNQETIDAVERLVKSGCTTNIHYVVSKDTINEAITRLEMDSFPKGVNAVIFILYKPVGNGIIEKVLKNTDSRIERFISLATKVKHPYRVGFDTCFTPALLRWGDTVPAVSIDACEAATFSMYIDSQMNCYPCSFGIWDKSISESMNSKTLREIWQGDKFVAFREQRKEKCSSCRQMELCRGGCRLGIDIDMC